MIKVLFCAFMLTFASDTYAQSKDTTNVASEEVAEAEAFELDDEEEIENFDFLYNDGGLLDYDYVLAENLIDEAYKHIGARYSYGSKGPHAFDCSGFTSYLYRQQGKTNIGASSREQYAINKPIKREELHPGDLVFFTSPRSGKGVGHVGMVIDYDPISNVFTFIHASTSAGVKVSKSSEPNYTRRYIGARRVE